MKSLLKKTCKLFFCTVLIFNYSSTEAQYSQNNLILLSGDSCVGDYIINALSKFELKSDNGNQNIRPTKIRTEGKLKIPSDKKSREIAAKQEIRLLPGFSSGDGASLRFYLNPSDCSTSIKKEKEDKSTEISGLSVFPNPNNGLFYLKIPLQKQSALGYSLWIYAADGGLIQRKEKFQESLLQINIQKNAKGFYFIKAKNLSTGKDFIRKIVVN